MYAKLFQDWEQQILRPVLTTLLTALILFASSMLFKPVRAFLFPSPDVKEYPLYCTAEPYLGPSGKDLLVDFFIINRTNDEYSREQLSSILQSGNRDPDVVLSPDISLKYSRRIDGRPVGKVEEVLLDRDFNLNKGELAIDRRDDSVSIKINRVGERAVMKVTIRVTGLPDLENSAVTRMAKGLVPLDFRRYQDGCYTRP
jgi:hypothetical protein